MAPGASAAWYFHHQDANFNVVLLTDSSGNEVEYYSSLNKRDSRAFFQESTRNACVCR